MTHCPGVQELYYLLPFRNSEDFDRLIKGLVKAGLKVDNLEHYKVHKENKMTGEEIRELIYGNTITGKRFGTPWSIKVDKNGKAERTWFSFVLKRPIVHEGKIWIEGDALCQQYKTLHNGLKDCADIYKNPRGNKKTSSEYLLLTDYWLYPFSVEE